MIKGILIRIRVVIWGMLIGKLSNRYFKDRFRESDPLFPEIFLLTHTVFSTVGTERLTGVSVGTGWDQFEMSGPKEDRQ